MPALLLFLLLIIVVAAPKERSGLRWLRRRGRRGRRCGVEKVLSVILLRD
jgi:hypothetical protein